MAALVSLMSQVLQQVFDVDTIHLCSGEWYCCILAECCGMQPVQAGLLFLSPSRLQVEEKVKCS